MAANKEILLIEIREDGARVVKRNIKDIGTTANATQDSVQQLKGLLGGLVTSKVLKDTIMLGDAYANLMNRLRVVTNSNYELSTAMEAVYAMTVKTRTSLEANVDMFARVMLNTQQMGLAMQDVVEFSTQLNHAIILSGVTAREAQWGMVQFSQALAAGALRGDELRATMEQLPVVTKVIADHMGVTRGELRLLAFQGRVTSRVMVEAFAATADELEEKFLRRIPTVDQGITTLRSSLIRFIGQQDQAIQGTSTLAQVLLWAARHMDTLGRIAEIAGIILGGILLKNLIGVVAQMRLFSLALIKTQPMLFMFGVAAAGVAVYADKIRVSNTGMATLSDTVRAFIPEIEAAAEGAITFANNMTKASEIEFKTDTTLQDLTMNLARFSDRFAAVFVGMHAVIKNGLDVISTHITRILFKIGAFFGAVSSQFRKDLLSWRTSIIALAGAAQQALSGNLAQAKIFINASIAAQRGGGFAAMAEDYKSRSAEINELFKTSGKTSSEAFMEGFTSAGTQTEDMFKRVFAGAQRVSSARTQGTLTPATDEQALTPTQSTLRKGISGNVEDTYSKLQDLEVLIDQGEISWQQYTRTYVKLQDKLLQGSTDVAAGWKRGFNSIALDITNFAEMSERVVTNAFSSMEDALVSFVATGKMDFKSLIDSVLADLTRLLLRQMLVKALGGAMSGPWGAFFSAAASSASSNGGSGSGRAAGGPMSAGRPYRILEHNKAEVFIPGSQGHMMSDQQVAAAPAASQQSVKIINIWADEDIGNYMDGPKGERIIINKSPGRKNTGNR